MPTPELIGLIAFAFGIPAVSFTLLGLRLRREAREAQECARASAWAKMDEFYQSGGPDRTYLA